MKVLWLSSVQLIKGKMLVSGTWIPGLLSILNEFYPELEIINVSRNSKNDVIKHSIDGLTEWLIPCPKKHLTKKSIGEIFKVIEFEKPDIIQVWGTEDVWGEFPFEEKVPNIPVILEIQGILESVSDNYYGDITPYEFIKCWSLKEFIKPTSSLPAIRYRYTKNIKRESNYIRKFKNIGIQSDWSKSIIKTINPKANIYHSCISLRSEFYNSPKWKGSDRTDIIIFSTAIMGQPLKGCYTLFKAFAIVREWFPNARMILAGAKEEGIRRSGFCRMLTKFAKRHGFYESIERVGPQNASGLCELYRNASVFVNPSNWESYSVVTAESMIIGCPTVAAYSGAMPELGVQDSILYFPKGDYRMCAYKILEIIGNAELAKQMSERSIKIAENRQNRKAIADSQIDTYNKLIGNL